MKKRMFCVLLGFCMLAVLLTACSFAENSSKQVAPKAPKSVQLRLISSTNLQDWHIALSPEYNSAIAKWVFNEKIEYLGPAPVQNAEVDVEDAMATRMADEKPHQPTQTTGAWIPVDRSSFTVKVSSDEQRVHQTGQAVYAIEKQYE